MEALVDSIRAAVAADASHETRSAGAAACRTILAALEGTPGKPLVGSPINVNAIANIVSVMKGVPPDQLLDLAIAKLRSALPPGTEITPVRPLKLHLIQPAKGAEQ